MYPCHTALTQYINNLLKISSYMLDKNCFIKLNMLHAECSQNCLFTFDLRINKAVQKAKKCYSIMINILHVLN